MINIDRVLTRSIPIDIIMLYVFTIRICTLKLILLNKSSDKAEFETIIRFY